jgi:two-component system, NtrC family, C4-dicarboxylate transport sensor histidine kinase DctB
MEQKSPATTAPPVESSCETLQREKDALSQQVKRLIRAEGKLYDYQQELDAQLKEYRELYDFGRRLNDIFDLKELFRETVAFVIDRLEYERALFLCRFDGEIHYRVCASDGYYDPAQAAAVTGLIIAPEDPCLSSLNAGADYVICNEESSDPALCHCRSRFLMHEYLIYPMGHNDDPAALMIVGNSAESALFYRRISDSKGGLLGIGNLSGLVSSLIEHRLSLEQMEKVREQERLAEAKYRSIFENAIEGIFQRDPEGRYLAANNALARTLGYDSPADLIAGVNSIRNDLYVDPARHDQLIALLQQHGAVEKFETLMYRKDRSVIWVSINLRVVRDGEGGILCYEGTTEEINERKKAEEALRESERRYRQLSEDLEQRVKEAVDELRQKDKIMILQGRQAVMGEMISNIAHQWRQPLNMLALLVQDLQMTSRREPLTQGFIDANVAKSLEIIQQMSKTIDYFRYFFKPDKEKVEFRVSETVHKTLSLLEGSFNAHGIATEFDERADPSIDGYPTEFIQVLLNLLINARDALTTFGPQNPKVTVTLCSEAGKTVVSVKDNAGGVPEEIIDRIFEPYFTTKGPEQGTGIGLFMCKTIIEKNMGGELSVRNLVDGAEFRIVI